MALIFALAFALRGAAACWLPEQSIWPDGDRYLKVAANLLGGHGFGGALDNRQSVPIQPVLIAGIEWLFGPDFRALRLGIAVIGAAVCVMGYLLAAELLGPVVGLIAGALLAVYPLYIYLFALFEYPQPFFILAMGIAFLSLYRYLRTGRHVELLLGGASLGLAILSVPTVLAFVPVLIASLVLMRAPHALRGAAVIVLAAAIPLGLWTARNYQAYGRVVLVNQAAGWAFWQSNNGTYYEYGKDASARCVREHQVPDYCQPGMKYYQRPAVWPSDEEQRVVADETATWRAGWAFIRASPTRSFLLSLRKLRELWSPLPDPSVRGAYNGGAAKSWVSVLSYSPILLLALAGMIQLRRNVLRLLPIYGYLLTFTAVYSVYLGTTRYRLPLDFFLIIFAAYALERGAETVSRLGRAAPTA